MEQITSVLRELLLKSNNIVYATDAARVVRTEFPNFEDIDKGLPQLIEEGSLPDFIRSTRKGRLMICFKNVETETMAQINTPGQDGGRAEGVEVRSVSFR